MVTAGALKQIFIILVDISGYTRFIHYHRVSLIHAEKIIAELMEAVLKEVDVPVMAHEILGDAISFYSIDDGSADQGDRIYQQLHRYFIAFREREASLISECRICQCEACQQIGKLRLKAILHYGQAAFTKVKEIQKISGEDVIISHRLLKNNVPSNEYMLLTSAFADKCLYLDESSLQHHREQYPDVGVVKLLYHDLDKGEVKPKPLPFIKRIQGFLDIEGYTIKRFFKKAEKVFVNLPGQHSVD